MLSEEDVRQVVETKDGRDFDWDEKVRDRSVAWELAAHTAVL